MCLGTAIARKFFKLYFQIVFYNVVIGLVFLSFGKMTFGFSTLFWFWPFKSLTAGFTGAFLTFFLFIPFINVLINALDRRSHLLLMVALLFVFSFLPTVPQVHVGQNYVCWFAIVYIVGAYIRKYPLRLFENRIYVSLLALTAFIAGNLSVILTVNVLSRITNIHFEWNHWLDDSEKITSLAAGVALFLFFRSLRLPYMRIINAVASTTFGVLLIHANCAAMRHWLWFDVLRNVESYREGDGVARAFFVVICVYALCVTCEFFRQKLFAEIRFLIQKVQSRAVR